MKTFATCLVVIAVLAAGVWFEVQAYKECMRVHDSALYCIRILSK
jgi:hypothetical protein